MQEPIKQRRGGKGVAQRLTNWQQKFKDTIELDAYADPSEPIMSVDDNVLSIRNAAHNIRLIYFLPIIGLRLCLSGVYNGINE